MTLKIPLAFLGRSLINNLRVTEFSGSNMMSDFESLVGRQGQSAEAVETVLEPSLPTWRCHKIVQAWPIRAWYAEPLYGGVGKRVIYLEDGPEGQQYHALVEPHTLFSRYEPVPGDYLVIYDDGYKSISPKKAFEEGYDRVSPVQEA